MYNYRIKKIVCDLERELWRCSDEQVDEIYTIIKNEYDSRTKTESTKVEAEFVEAKK